MFKQHHQLMLSILVAIDLVVTAAAWVVTYLVRFSGAFVDAPKGVPPFATEFLPLLPLVLVLTLLAAIREGLYRPKRYRSVFHEIIDVVRTCTLAWVFLIAIAYFLRGWPYSRAMMGSFLLVHIVSLSLARLLGRWLLRNLRVRGRNLRSAAIVGTGRLAQQLLHSLRRNTWTGVQVQYFVAADDDDHHNSSPRTVRGVPVRGEYEQLDQLLRTHPVDAVFVAVPYSNGRQINRIFDKLGLTTADVLMVPDVSGVYLMRQSVSDLDGLPIINIRQSPMYGWNAILKRTFDIVISSVALVICAPLLAGIAIAVRLTSSGPVLFRQTRCSIGGQEFEMLKFRSMIANAEEQTGAVWTMPDDPRRTKVGSFLRRTSLDELPQLWNVLCGDMSLVGPRPERPEFIDRFQHELPRYMLRHKTRAGITGWAQVHGLRGNTSLRRRLRYDLYYINNWSLGLDIRILFMTVFSPRASRNAE